MTKPDKVLVAMSGGVDSAAAALLLMRQGYECIGVTLRLFTCLNKKGADISDSAPEGARAAAKHLGIKHIELDVSKDFEENVIKKFVGGYQEGYTPNPCVECNRYIKFGALLKYADELGAQYMATGHYASIVPSVGSGYALKKAADPAKDQSYVLYHLTQTQLSRVLFPLGGMSKNDVRKICREAGLPNADTAESQDICFVPEGDHTAFITWYTGTPPAEGDFLDVNGNTLGRHSGITRYTIGQRKGLGVVLHRPAYVLAKHAGSNTVSLGDEEELFTRELNAADFNWIANREENAAGCTAFRAKAKIRYRQAEQNAEIFPITPDGVRIVFDKPQRAVAPGQAVVVYDGDFVAGGGKIV